VEQNILKKIKETTKYILSLKGFTATVAIITGSGLSDIEKNFTVLKKIQYSKIPHFSKVTVQGHKGELLLCSYQNTNILIFKRFH
jgi:purine nucleoside phosphorylase